MDKQFPQASLSQDQATTEQALPGGIFHRLHIGTPVETVFGALTTQNGLTGWWTPEALAKPEVGSILRFTFDAGYFKEFKVEELKPYGKVKWRCLKGYETWIGTTIIFELEPDSKGCWLSFQHAGWTEDIPGFAKCCYDWAMFLRSLKLLCETGKGLPFPDQYR